MLVSTSTRQNDQKVISERKTMAKYILTAEFDSDVAREELEFPANDPVHTDDSYESGLRLEAEEWLGVPHESGIAGLLSVSVERVGETA
jgi:hypothetical protein